MDEILVNKIEELIKERRTLLARKSIKTLLQKSQTVAVVLQACEWYRRLSLYKEGFRLILSLNSERHLYTSEENKQVELKLAEYFALVGASRFALKTISHYRALTANENDIIAGIHLINYDYDLALTHFENALKLSPSENSRPSLILKLNAADCLIRLGKNNRAIKMAENVIKHASDSLLKAMSIQALGQYYSEAGKFKIALDYLKEAERMFPTSDRTFDFALLLRWLGFTYGRLGQESKAKSAFAKSTQIIRDSGLSDDTWLENYLLMYRCKLLNRQQTAQLLSYPEVPWKFIGEKAKGLKTISSKSCKIRILPEADEYWVGELRYLGIPIEIKLLKLVRQAGVLGIESEKLKYLLWPEERESYLQLEQRLFLLAQRINKLYKIKISWNTGRVFLETCFFSLVGVDFQKKPSFFNARKNFKAEELSQHYQIKKSARYKYIDRWLTEGKIASVSRGRGAVYSIII